MNKLAAYTDDQLHRIAMRLYRVARGYDWPTLYLCERGAYNSLRLVYAEIERRNGKLYLSH